MVTPVTTGYKSMDERFFGPLQGYRATLPAPPSCTLRVPAQLWALNLASALRSNFAIYFLNHGRLFATDGPSTSSDAANALLPMSALENLYLLLDSISGGDTIRGQYVNLLEHALMQKKLTITLDETVYDGLHKVIGRRRISRFIEELVRPHILAHELEAAYQQMAQDETREAEALAWAEATVGDVSDEPR
jgi:hypothetical protein